MSNNSNIKTKKEAKTLEKCYPELAREYSPKNRLKASEVFPGGKTKYWWVCSLGHEWENPIYDRIRTGKECTVCSGNTIVSGVNDLATKNPELMKEWHPTKNSLNPSTIAPNSGLYAWWVCAKGHEWKSRIIRRNKESKCPICLHRTIIPGINDLLTEVPELAREWDYHRNNLTPNEVGPGAAAKVWWKCSKFGHSWSASINSRFLRKSGCPVCANCILLVGFNDLYTRRPDLAREWHPTKNAKTPRDYKFSERIKAWWRCDKGHEWETTIFRRNEGGGCHFCKNRVFLPGFNDLASLKPEITKEWHPTKNTKTPQQVGLNSTYRAVWICNDGHEWQAIVRQRAVRDSNCPKCYHKGVSQVEASFRAYFKTKLYKVNEDHTFRLQVKGFERPKQIDIIGLFRDKNIIIEYDGEYFHKNKINLDLKLTKALLKEDFLVVRIREKGLERLPLKHERLLQLNYKWSLKPDKVEELGNEIMDWIKEVCNSK